MASTSGSDGDQPSNDQALLMIASEMTRHVQTIETIFQELEALRRQALIEQRDEIREAGTEIDEAVITDIDELNDDHELLKNAFLKLLYEFFIISDRGVCHGLKRELYHDEKFVLGMKIKLQRLKDLKEHLKSKIQLLSAEIYGYKLGSESPFYRQTNRARSSFGSALLAWDETGAYGSTTNLDDFQDWDPRLFAKKLRIIKYYYLKQSEIGENRFSSSTSINSVLQNKFGWLRSPKIKVDLDRGGEDGDEFETSDINEVTWQIRRLVRQRRREMALARGQGKKSLLEYVILDDESAGEFTTLNLMHKTARELGDALSRHVSDMFFLVLETGESFHKFKDHLRFVLRWLDEKGKTPVIRRVLGVLREVEEELYLLNKFQLFPAYSDVPRKASQGQREAMERLFDTFLGEFLRLESIMSYRSLSDEYLSRTSIELKTFDKTLKECEKVVAEIGEEMQILKEMHVFVWEDDKESKIMKSFESVRATIVAKAWSDIREGYKAW